MSDRQTGATSSDDLQRPSRRRLLGILGTSALTGLAGCSGGGGGGNGDSETPTRTPTENTPADEASNPNGDSSQTTRTQDDATSTQADTGGYEGGDDPTCTDLTGSYVTLDPGERRLILRTEIPRAYEEAGQINYSDNGSTAEPTTGPIGLFATMRISQDLHSDSTPFPDRDGYEQIVETEFNGQTRRAAVDTGESFETDAIVVTGDMLASGTYDGEEQLFAIRIKHQVVQAEETDTETCRSALREAMAHTFASMEPNPNTTVAEML